MAMWAGKKPRIQKLWARRVLVGFFALVGIAGSLATDGLLRIPNATAYGPSGTVRQEINILDSSYSATDTAISSDEFSQLDPTKYSGTVAYYFEVVGTASAGSSGNIHLRRQGTTTDDASIAISGLGTSATRLRSAAFTAPGSATEYFVQADAAGSGNTLTIKAARIIVVQTSDPMTATETQVEIGTHVIAQTNTATTPLSDAKYWTYSASAWDNNPLFYAEVTHKVVNTNLTVYIQEDDGKYGSWTNKATIVASSSSSTPTRTRTFFAPTDGRHYRLATIIVGATGTYNYDIYNAKIVADQTGTALDPITKLQPQYLLLNSADNNSATLQGYQTLYDSSEWSGKESFRFAVDSDNTSSAANLRDISNGNGTVTDSDAGGLGQNISSRIHYVQGANNYTGSTSGQQQQVAFSSNVSAGDLIVVAVGALTSSYTPTIWDSQGNTYTQAATVTNSSIPYTSFVYYALAGSSGALTVHHDSSTSVGFRRMAIHEYSGVDSFDVTSTQTGTTGIPASGAATANHDDELVFGWGVSSNGITGAGAGFTARQTVGSETTEDKVLPAAGPAGVIYPTGTSQWSVIMATFYNSSGYSLNLATGHELDTGVTNTTGVITATRIIVNVSMADPVVSVSVSDGNISYGVVGTGSSKDTTSSGLNDTQVATNDGTVAEDLNVKGQDSANWTLAGSSGANQYKHEFCTSGSGSPDPCDASPTWTALTTSYQALATTLATSGAKKFDLKLSTPTSTTSSMQQSVDITIQAVQH
jgi:hypothetical protein